MEQGTKQYNCQCCKGDDRMHNMSEWNRKYGDLISVRNELRKEPVYDGLAMLIVDVLIMLVEDKIKEMQE